MSAKRNPSAEKEKPQPKTDPKTAGKTGKAIKLIFIILIIVLLIILILQNLASAPVAILFWKGQIPVIAIMLIFGLSGFVLGFLVFSLTFRSPRAAKKKSAPKDDEETDVSGQI